MTALHSTATATFLAEEVAVQREMMANMYKRFLRSAQDARRLGRLRFKLRAAAPDDYYTHVPRLGSSRALQQYMRLLQLSVSSLAVIAREARQLETTVAYDGYWTESAQAAALLTELAETNLVMASTRLTTLSGLAERYQRRMKEDLAAAKARADAAAGIESVGNVPSLAKLAVANARAARRDSAGGMSGAGAAGESGLSNNGGGEESALTKGDGAGGPRRWASAMAREVEGKTWLEKEKDRIRGDLEASFARDWHLAALHETARVRGVAPAAHAPLLRPPR